MIVPLSFGSAKNFDCVRNLFSQNGALYVSSYEIRPSKLFDGASGAEQRLNILINYRSCNEPSIITTGVIRWNSEQRYLLFVQMHYVTSIHNERFWRFSNELEIGIYKKYISKALIATYQYPNNKSRVHYRSAGLRYWIIFNNCGFNTESASNKYKEFGTISKAHILSAVLNSDIYWWYYSTNYDMFNQTDANILSFRYTIIDDGQLERLNSELEDDMEANKRLLITNKSNGEVNKSYAYDKKLSKPIIDEIDKVLAKHYGFTEEELDFIINYDIKYRMGDELNNDCDE